MKISLNWIKEFIDLPKELTIEQIAYDLTMSTVEVEGIEKQADGFANMVVGRVVELKKHPNADKLQLAMTDIGGGKVKQIVCGGTNLYEGMLVLVALPGAKVKWHGEGDLVTLKEAKIRGEHSFGMICAGEEVGLSNFDSQNNEIIDLSFINSTPGTAIADALNLNDVIFDIDNKSLTNRPDLWGHYGMARELAAIYKLPFKKIINKKSNQKIKDKIKVNIKTSSCRRYLSAVVDNIKVESSPDWLKNRLQAIGQKSINNIVDLSNFVMYELGQPTHVFDFDNLSGQQIVIRQSNDKEPITTLDGEVRKLSEDDAVIADSKKAVAIAGIMGGLNSGITKQTTKIVLEAASFSAINIRRSSKRLNLRTESSMRFEKNIDTERAETAMYRMIELLFLLQPEAKLGPIVDKQKKLDDQVVVKVSIDFLNSRLGQNLQVDDILDILRYLEFSVNFKNGIFTIKVPPHRATGDVSLPEDIVEEIARIKGYDNFPFVAPEVKLHKAVWQPEISYIRQIKEFLSFSAGMHEVFNYPWCSDQVLNILNFQDKNRVVIANPPAENQNILQDTLLPNIIKNVEDNAKNFKDFSIYEISRVFSFAGKYSGSGDDTNILPNQKKMLAGAVVGENREYTFFKLKGIIESLLKFFHIDGVDLQKLDNDIYDDGLVLQAKNEYIIGKFGFLRKDINDKFEFNNLSVGFFEIDLESLVRLMGKINIYKPLPQYPEVVRDLSIMVNDDISWKEIKQQVSTSKIIKKVIFFDQYKGEKIPQGKKSISFRVVLSVNKTLTSKEADKEIEKILSSLYKNLGAILRDF